MRVINLQSKKVQKEGYPNPIVVNGKKYFLANMELFGGNVEREKKEYRKKGIKFRVVMVKNPKGMGAWVFYTLGGRRS